MIKQKVLTRLNELEKFTYQDIQKAIWVAQGFKIENYFVRNGYYCINIKAWKDEGLIKQTSRAKYEITPMGKLWLVDKDLFKSISKQYEQRDNEKAKQRAISMDRQKEWLESQPYGKIKGQTITNLRRLTKDEMDSLGWYKSPLVLELSNRTCLIPQMDDEGNDGGAILHYDYKTKDEELLYTT